MKAIGRVFVVALLMAIAAAGCSAASVVSPTPAPPDAPAAPAPSAPGDGVVGGGGGGIPVQPGQPALLIPKPGQLNVHDVGIDELTARVAGRHVVINAKWTSGVEPCSVLDSVVVERQPEEILVSVREGSSDLGAMCMEIAMVKVTVIDLGDLDPGDYKIVPKLGSAAGTTITVR